MYLFASILNFGLFQFENISYQCRLFLNSFAIIYLFHPFFMFMKKVSRLFFILFMTKVSRLILFIRKVYLLMFIVFILFMLMVSHLIFIIFIKVYSSIFMVSIIIFGLIRLVFNLRFICYSVPITYFIRVFLLSLYVFLIVYRSLELRHTTLIIFFVIIIFNRLIKS